MDHSTKHFQGVSGSHLQAVSTQTHVDQKHMLWNGYELQTNQWNEKFEGCV